MKKLLTLAIFIASVCRVNAYEIDVSQVPHYTLSVKAHLIIDREKRTLGLQYRNKVIDQNVSIEKSAIWWAIATRDASLANITITPKTRSNGSTGINITRIIPSEWELDAFKGTELMLREFQKDEKIKRFYESFIKHYDVPSAHTIADLPFHPQAPLATEENWSIHEESCEEAALLLNHYITNDVAFSPEKMNNDIIAMNNFQVSHGIPEDKYSSRYKKYFLRDLTDPYEMYSLLGMDYLGYTNGTILMVRQPSLETIERFVNSDHVITVPMKYTSELRNKFIRTGKSFHVVNIVGYTPTEFITLDPGTKNGAYLSYPKDRLFQSIRENGDYFLALKRQ